LRVLATSVTKFYLDKKKEQKVFLNHR